MDGSAKDIGEIFDVITEKLPKMMKGLTESFYSEEAGTKIGKAVGSMYKELVECGIPEEKALELAKDYLKIAKDLTNGMPNN